MTGMRYEFRVDGRLSGEARAAFADMTITEAPPQTILDGDVVDESHLYGIIAQLQVLGIPLVSARPARDGGHGARSDGPC